VVQDNTAHMRSIKTGVTDAGLTQVTGINPGDVLANSSFDKLQDNVPVSVAGSGKPAPGSTPGTPSGNTSGATSKTTPGRKAH
jgi:membrane fusion protein, multidrug efflux system